MPELILVRTTDVPPPERRLCKKHGKPIPPYRWLAGCRTLGCAECNRIANRRYQRTEAGKNKRYWKQVGYRQQDLYNKNPRKFIYTYWLGMETNSYGGIKNYMEGRIRKADN